VSKRIFGCEASKAAASSDNSLCEARAFQATDAATEFWPADARPARIDLHCHSDASNEADEAVLNSIQCPECFSTPREVYEQAQQRGMDFVTITDHDSLGGVSQLSAAANVLSGEEVTCYFPEDHCKIHLLVWGLSGADHDALQAAAQDIYRVADIVAELNLAHSVAHPFYRQNDVLERWHLERLLLLFKGFETLNGAHSVLHREAVEAMVDELTPRKIADLAAAHCMPPRWPQPHIKSRTGGSDDHGLFNIGRTWTEYPAGTQSVDEVLDCLRQGRCRAGGEAGSSLKLAHNFYGVGIRYYGRKMRQNAAMDMQDIVLRTLVGERRSIRRRDLVGAAVKRKFAKLANRLLPRFTAPKQPAGTALLLDLFIDSFRRHMDENPAIHLAVSEGRAALAEHESMFDLLSSVNRDVTAGIAESVRAALSRGELAGIFDSISSIAAHQFMLLPYYFAMFHQNRERRLMPRLSGRAPLITPANLRLGVFTDTFDEINGVSRFIQDIGRQAHGLERSLVVHTCSAEPRVSCPGRKNFTPLLSEAMPKYPEQKLVVPPVAQILEWADRQQFDAIHVHTPGPMGLCGWLVAKMLRVPVLMTYHTDFPRYVRDLTGDHRLTSATEAYMTWFFGQAHTIFSRSKDYCGKLRGLGLGDKRLEMVLPGVDTEKFSPEMRDVNLWPKLRVGQTHKLLYAGRVSVEKNLPFLVECFRRLCRLRQDVALVVAGDGPYRVEMERAAAGLPVHFLGFQNDQELSALYASSDLFVFPSATDTLGQVVAEAQAAGLPVLVSDQGGPKELMDDQITGLVLPTGGAGAAGEWANAINGLLSDAAQRMRMSRTAPRRAARFSRGQMFEVFWSEHVLAAVEQDRQTKASEPKRQAAMA
jgi:glycosyltransferase involved in cell wall biosynthesis